MITIKFMLSGLRILCFLAAWCLLPIESYAHSSNQSILKLSEKQSTLSGEWSIPLKFLDMILDLDTNHDQKILWEEVLLSQPRIENYLKQALNFKQEGSETGNCTLDFERLMLQDLREGLALYVPFTVTCPQPVSNTNFVSIDYQLFFNADPWHRGFIYYQSGNIEQQWIASPNKYEFKLSNKKPSRLSQIQMFIIEGVWHIWIGLDHILFLIALLFPSVFCYQNQHGKAPLIPSIHKRFSPMFSDTLKIVTAFTLSHSLTLGLAAFNIMNLPPALVEIAIAASVVLSALLIWLPRWQQFRWQIAFAFGFIHGFGFANVLGDLTLPQESFALCLFAFNIGVELGQLVIVALVLPLMFSIRNLKIYTKVMIPVAMNLIAIVGLFWIYDRSTGL